MRTAPPSRARVAAVAVLVLLVVGLAGVLRGEGLPSDEPTVPTPPALRDAEDVEPVPDPFAWEPERAPEFLDRAAAGNANLLYRLSPGGAAASAARTARWREEIERTAEAAGVDPDLLEGLVFLESAGRADAITPAGTEGAVGLTQIVAETGRNLLGMSIDVDRSARYTRRIARAERRGRQKEVDRLERRRRAVDPRYDPDAALAGTARYLTLALERFGREDFALVSYHMGMGNLEGVLRAYAEDEDTPIAELVAEEDLSYLRVYFDSTPLNHPEAQRRLARLGDDSSNYLWKVHAARDIMRLHREDPGELARLASLHTAKNSAEEVLHPPAETERFASPADLRDAWESGAIVALPADPRATALRVDPGVGELARRLDRRPGLYRGLRPEALAMALYIAAQVREIAGAGTLTLTSTVRDQAYQDLLVGGNREATRNYSLHTTGWAFDIARRYRNAAQAAAFQFVLDRLRTLNAISWVREPGAIHITASDDGEALLGLLDRTRAGGG